MKDIDYIAVAGKRAVPINILVLIFLNLDEYIKIQEEIRKPVNFMRKIKVLVICFKLQT